MIPIAIFRAAAVVASMRILYAVLPNGDVERCLFQEFPEGVRATIERKSARSGARTIERRDLPRARYGWRIETERRSVVKALPGRPTGLVREAFVLSAWIDSTPDPNVAPHPVQAFQFYAPSRKAAEALRDRLRRALTP